MPIGNTFVAAVLRSPAHRLLSGSTDLVRFTGRRTGRTITLPTQYARDGDAIVIVAARPETKQWWRNFLGGRDLDVLLAGTWEPMVGSAHRGADEPAVVGPMLDTFVARFPRTARSLEGGTATERTRGAVVVSCRPR